MKIKTGSRSDLDDEPGEADQARVPTLVSPAAPAFAATSLPARTPRATARLTSAEP